MKKRICFIAQFPPPIHGLSKAVETLYNSNLDKQFVFEKIDITNNKKFFLNFIKIIKSEADLFYFTISQTKMGNLRDLIILKLLNLKNKKCLIHLHGGYYRTLIDKDVSKWQRNANYRAIKKIDGTIILGDSLHYIFKQMLSEQKIFTVPNCVDDLYLMSSEDLKSKIEKQKKKQIKNVLYLSNFIKTKGYRYVLEMAILEKKNHEKHEIRNFKFDFAGAFLDDQEKKYFFEFIKNNELENYVTYHGAVFGEKKKQLLKKSDVFVLLTTYSKEGQPISILEAMGNGMLIVTTDHAGIPDIVKDKINGIVVNKNNISINKIYENLKQLDFEKIILNNYNSIQQNYLEDNYIEKMKAIFEKI